MAVVYLGLGSNLGDRVGNIREALRLLAADLQVKAVSSVYETEPIGFTDQPHFLNIACRAITVLCPEALLKLAKTIESGMGRVPSFPNAPRPIDIDILLYDRLVINKAELAVPHPRMLERAFVLVPLNEIAPGAIHPVLKKTVKELLTGMGRITGVVKYAEAEAVTNRRHYVPGIS